MAINEGTIALITKEFEEILQPIYEKIENDQLLDLFEELGIKFPSSLANVSSVKNAMSAVTVSANNIKKLTEQLKQAITDENIAGIISNAFAIIGEVAIFIESLDHLADECKNAGHAFDTVTEADIDNFFANFATKLFNYASLKYLELKHQILEGVTELVGLVERIPRQIGSVDVNKPPFIERNLKLDRIPKLLSDPEQLFSDLYSWGDPIPDTDLILTHLANLLEALNISLTLLPPDATHIFKRLQAGPLEIFPEDDHLKIEVSEKVNASDTINIPLGLPDWTVTSTIEGKLDAGAELTVEPPLNFDFSSSVNAGFNVKISYTGNKPEDDPFLFIGQTGGSRLQAQQIIFSAGANLIYDSSTSSATGSGFVEAEVKEGKLVIGISEADGFLSTILGGVNLESDFSFTVGVDSKEGFYFVGSSSLEIELPVHLDLSVVEVESIIMQLLPEVNAVPIDLGSNLKFNLGPLKAVIENMGLTTDLEFLPDQSGNLGPVDLNMAFKPPNGVGLSLDAGVIKGGGYLYFDFDREEYAGALELTFTNVVSLKAIGLITTRMPDGSDGFSLLIIITAEFGTGIQLGFGFTLLGVGGLLGLNRTMRREPLAEGVKTGSVNNIMFPENVVENAPQIISDLRKYFPPEADTFLIGPMAKIGWGTPTLVSLSLGIIIEIPPGNIAILGVLKVALPTEDAALLVLQVSFIGALEVDKERLWFSAFLFDSRVLFITIEGGMGLLMAWGEHANFVVTVGGFHPAFDPPPLPFSDIPRISVNILNESWGKIRVMGYFAVTSNTAQFGAYAELYFGFDAANVQGHLGFDALFQFSPFYFIIQVSASFSVEVFGIGLFSIGINMSLQGPAPWRAQGSFSISILFFEISVDFDFTWGEEANTTLPPIEMMPLMKAEMNKLENWQAVVPPSNSLLVSLGEIKETVDELVLHPVGTLQVSQRKAPLDITLDKIGTQKPSDANKFTLKTAGSTLEKSEGLKEQFALAQFQDMDNAEKLSRPGFEEENSGLELSMQGRQLATGKAVKRNIRYETIIIDTNYKRFVIRFRPYLGVLYRHFLKGNAAAKCELSFRRQQELMPFEEKIDIKQPAYAVASVADNTAFNGADSFASEALAREHLNQQVAEDPSLSNALHVIPQQELNTAA